MNKKMIIAAVAASMIAVPAVAQNNAGFTGARVEANVGANDLRNVPDSNDVVYGAQVGVDFPVGNDVTFGVEANTQNVFEDERKIGAAARVGYAMTPRTLAFGKVGYANYRDVFSRELDGVVVGAGLEHLISDQTYVKAEYNYSDFNRNVGSHAVLAGVGIRF